MPVPHKLICRSIITGFGSLPISAVMESADNAKYFSDLGQEYATAEVSFGQFLDGDARDDGRFFGHDPGCNAAAGCNCSLLQRNISVDPNHSEWNNSRPTRLEAAKHHNSNP